MLELLGFCLLCLSSLCIAYLITELIVSKTNIFPPRSEEPFTLWLTVLIWVLILSIIF